MTVKAELERVNAEKFFGKEKCIRFGSANERLTEISAPFQNKVKEIMDVNEAHSRAIESLKDYCDAYRSVVTNIYDLNSTLADTVYDLKLELSANGAA